MANPIHFQIPYHAPCANSIVQQLKQKSKGCKDIYSLAFERKLLPILALQIGLERLKNTRRKTG